MIFDYDAFYATVADQFPAALSALVPEARTRAQAIRADADALLESNANLVVDDASRANVRQAALILASYRALSDLRYLSGDQLRAALVTTYSAPFRQWVLSTTRELLDSADDPLTAIVAFSKPREVTFFGPSFTFDHLQDDRFAYLVDIRRCLWHAFFVANEAPELTTVFCGFDANWSDAIDSNRHGLDSSGRPHWASAATAAASGLSAPTHGVQAIRNALNSRRIFDNLSDTQAGLRDLLEASFSTVEIDVIGSVAVFIART